MRHNYKTEQTCASQISFDLDGNIVRNISFTGGCNGNLQAISRLLNGVTVEHIEEKCSNIKCGFRNTSCSGQLAIAARRAYEKELKENSAGK